MSDVDKKEAYEESSNDVKHPHVSTTAVDTAAALVSGNDIELDPEEAKRIRRKIDRHIMPLMCILYWIQFMDKTTLGMSIASDVQVTSVIMSL